MIAVAKPITDPNHAERQGSGRPPGGDAVIQALPDPVLVVDVRGAITYVNTAAEQFFALGREHLNRQTIQDLTSFDSPLIDLITRVRESGISVADHGVELTSHHNEARRVDIRVGPLDEFRDDVVVCLRERTFADAINRQLNSRDSVRSVTAMAAVLAHEVKNPLAGIRGAAQLLEGEVSGDGQAFARLIRDEVDRICALVENMELFADERPIEVGPVNIHEVLDHVRRLAVAGSIEGRVRFKEHYDPSLPSVLGNRDQLVQALLNLVNNAVEALPESGGEVALMTAYRHGMRATIPGSRSWVELPLEVSVKDNGPGIPEYVRANLFDAFVSGKRGGTGLGLSLVAKIVRDHGGVIEFESRAKRTEFRMRLPVAVDA